MKKLLSGIVLIIVMVFAVRAFANTAILCNSNSTPQQCQDFINISQMQAQVRQLQLEIQSNIVDYQSQSTTAMVANATSEITAIQSAQAGAMTASPAINAGT